MTSLSLSFLPMYLQRIGTICMRSSLSILVEGSVLQSMATAASFFANALTRSREGISHFFSSRRREWSWATLS